MAINFCPDAAQKSAQEQNSAEHAAPPYNEQATNQAKLLPLKQCLHQPAPKLPQQRQPPQQPQKAL